MAFEPVVALIAFSAGLRYTTQWSKRGAHLLLQTRVKTLNRALGTVCKRWYPDIEVEELPEAA